MGLHGINEYGPLKSRNGFKFTNHLGNHSHKITRGLKIFEKLVPSLISHAMYRRGFIRHFLG